MEAPKSRQRKTPKVIEVEVTAQDKIKAMEGEDVPDQILPGVTRQQTVASLSDEDSRKMDRAETQFVPKTMNLEPPEADANRSISDQVFQAPEEAPSAKSERSSPVKNSQLLTGKNLALLVGIAALGTFLAL